MAIIVIITILCDVIRNMMFNKAINYLIISSCVTGKRYSQFPQCANIVFMSQYELIERIIIATLTIYVYHIICFYYNMIAPILSTSKQYDNYHIREITQDLFSNYNSNNLQLIIGHNSA